MAILVNIRDFIVTNLLANSLFQMWQCDVWTTIHDYISQNATVFVKFVKTSSHEKRASTVVYVQ